MTPTKPHILGIPGSLRQATYSRAVLRGLQEIARELGTETKIPYTADYYFYAPAK
jgi:NAD(P)H-dependent FMN reductase